MTPLRSGERRRVREAEGKKHESDWERATGLVDLLVGSTHVPAYLSWMAGMTADIVRSWRFRRLVDALIPVLLEHEVVSARTVRDVFTAADPEWRPAAAAMT